MSLLSFGGADVLRAEIHMGARGAWYAHVVLDTPTMPSGQATLAAAGGISLVGTVQGGGVFLDAAHIVVIGGAAGLGRPVIGSYQACQLGDVLSAILSQAAEQRSGTVAQSLLSVALPRWTLGKYRAGRALDEIASMAAAILGQPVQWRVLSDGSVWMGVETWPAAAMPAGADVIEIRPTQRRYVIGCDTPSLIPGVTLAGVGQVAAVSHFCEPARIRTWALT